MSAIVASDEGDNWFTNSRTWGIILELAMGTLSAETRDEYEWYADSIGIDFSLVEVDKRAAMASWLLEVSDRLQGELGEGHGWADERNRAHLGELSVLLRRQISRSGGHVGGV